VIVCSCNVLSDIEVKSAIASAKARPQMSSIYASLGCAAKCGRCVSTIKTIRKEIRRSTTTNSVAIEAALVLRRRERERAVGHPRVARGLLWVLAA
jgi:bacterioferritin-associated ferredoxin